MFPFRIHFSLETRNIQEIITRKYINKTPEYYMWLFRVRRPYHCAGSGGRMKNSMDLSLDKKGE